MLINPNRSQRRAHRTAFVETLADVESEAFDLANECGAPINCDDDPASDLIRNDDVLLAAAAVFLKAVRTYRAEHATLKASIDDEAALPVPTDAEHRLGIFELLGRVR